jgi:hypothetical protein
MFKSFGRLRMNEAGGCVNHCVEISLKLYNIGGCEKFLLTISS